MRTLEQLQDEVRSRTVREQFSESRRAYSAGAYRTATIALWIAVVQDLLEKVRELADGGDAAAVQFVKEVDAARASNDLTKLLRTERDILDVARDGYELITTQTHGQLERLQRDRNACAHPSFLTEDEEFHSVSEEQIRAYMVLAVDTVLSQPTTVGKALVDRFMKDVRGPAWPQNSGSSRLRV